MATASALDRWLAAHGRRAQRCRFGDLEYARLNDDDHGRLRGTVILPSGREVPGYPRIGRILALEAGLAAHFDGPVWAEEKVDGYNVRIVCEQGRLLALTRGGFVCPFTSHRLEDLLPAAVFEDHPDLVLCAELAGPESPYHRGPVPGVERDVALFVFDVLGPDGRLWDTPEVEALSRAYGLPRAACFGRFGLDQVQALHELAQRLDAEGREGLVFKQAGAPGRRVKYATAASSIHQIGIKSPELLELPADFFVERILRLALFEDEHGRPLRRHAAALGEAMLGGLEQALADFRRCGRVAFTYRCRVRAPAVADALLAHLEQTSGHQVRIRRVGLERQGDEWLLTFERIPSHINGLLHELLGGTLVFD